MSYYIVLLLLLLSILPAWPGFGGLGETIASAISTFSVRFFCLLFASFIHLLINAYLSLSSAISTSHGPTWAITGYDHFCT